MKLSPQVAKQMGKKTAMMGSEVSSPGIFPINMVEPHSRLNKGGSVMEANKRPEDFPKTIKEMREAEEKKAKERPADFPKTIKEMREAEEKEKKYRKGGVVYANCGASVKPAQKRKK